MEEMKVIRGKAMYTVLEDVEQHGGHTIRHYPNPEVPDALTDAVGEGFVERVEPKSFWNKKRQSLGGTLLAEFVPSLPFPLYRLTEKGSCYKQNLEKLLQR
jgi:hypothetical protein